MVMVRMVMKRSSLAVEGGGEAAAPWQVSKAQQLRPLLPPHPTPPPQVCPTWGLAGRMLALTLDVLFSPPPEETLHRFSLCRGSTMEVKALSAQLPQPPL